MQTYHEKRVISPSANDTDLDPVLGVPLSMEESQHSVNLARTLRETHTPAKPSKI